MKTYILKAILPLALLFASVNAFAQPGNVTGVITNCYNNAPIPGAIVMIGSNTYTCLANGTYFASGIPAGPVTLTAAATGYTPTTFSTTVISNQTVTANACLGPVPATITGVITNCATGSPIIGAKITLGTQSTYSVAGGTYTLNVFPGITGTLTVQKEGFATWMGTPGNYSPPNTYTVNVSLHSSVSPPSSIYASLNSTQDTVHLSWENGYSSKEYIYDDGIPEGCIAGSKLFLKFTSCSGFNLNSAKFRINICGGLTPFNLTLYDDSGPGGTPGTQIIPFFTYTPVNYGWNQVIYPVQGPYLLQGNYYLAVIHSGPPSGVYVDTTTNQHRSFIQNGAGPLTELSGNVMIRVVLTGQCPELNTSTTTHTVYRLLWGQENTPSLWTTVGTTTPGSMTYDDGAWVSLPCNPYRYAVKLNHPCGGSSTASFSNVIGKCWTAQVNVHAERCCSALGNDGIMVKFQNLTYPDTVYTGFTDAGGNVTFNNIWKGNYLLTISVFGCYTYTQSPLTIMGNMTLNCIMTGGPIVPPSNLTINEGLQQATWNPPSLDVCVNGYNVYINSVLNGFTPDTTYQIPPLPALAGQKAQLCVEAVFGYNVPAMAPQICDSFQVFYMMPPANFSADTSGCSVTLNWTKPLINGNPPQGLLGYNIYRDNNFIHFCPSPDSLTYTENGLNGGVYTYNATAFYDLTTYGSPGLYGESDRSLAADTVSVLCAQSIPFNEGWNYGTFSFTGWTFEPSQGTWDISNSEGQPIPSAVFTGSGKGGSKSSYEYSLVSPELSASEWICSVIHLQFDLKLEDISAGSTEKLYVEVKSSGVWNTVAQYSNNGSFDWQTKDIVLSGIEGNDFSIRYRVWGNDLSAFHKWGIDNIKIYGVCPAPTGLQAIAETQEVELIWQAPCTQSTGYNIWRSGAEGNPPFSKINPSVISTTSFTDYPVPWSFGDTYNYYVTSVQDESGCESAASDTVTASFPVGISQGADKDLKIYPNPAKDFVDITFTGKLLSAIIQTSEGIVISEVKINSERARIDTRNLTSGLYFLTIKTEDHKLFRKLVIN